VVDVRVRTPAGGVQHAVERTRDPEAKLDHLAVCRKNSVEYCKSAGFDALEFTHQALPDTALEAIDLTTSLLGKSLSVPLMVAPMTGGTPACHAVNLQLAAAAERWGLGFAVGSQRVALEESARERWFVVRDVAPTVPLFANIGGAQLVRGWGASQARRAVEMVGADALFIHLNPLQEALQGGDVDFRGLLQRIGTMCTELGSEGIPVFVREVGFGLSTEAAAALTECGVAGIDCAGAGGTSWAKAEALCTRDPRRRELGMQFGEWGIATADSIRNVRRCSPTVPLIATGGLRNGQDVAKAIALGADITALARPFLVAADHGELAIDRLIADLIEGLRICMFGIGAQNIAQLKNTPYLRPTL
jgi:isopentenyl-diphosphate delta-isomerase